MCQALRCGLVHAAGRYGMRTPGPNQVCGLAGLRTRLVSPTSIWSIRRPYGQGFLALRHGAPTSCRRRRSPAILVFRHHDPDRPGHRVGRCDHPRTLNGLAPLDPHETVRQNRRMSGSAVSWPAPAERRSVDGPVRRAVSGGRWLAHATRLTAWIRNVNPHRSEFCNSARCR